MNSFHLACGNCSSHLAFPLTGANNKSACPACGKSIDLSVFPSLIKGVPKGQKPEWITVADEAGCFYHPGKKAVKACESCGRFMCSLCDIDFNGRHLCPVCIESGQGHDASKEARNTVTRWDTIALMIAVFPVLIFYFTLFTAPFAIYVAIKYWNEPVSISPRGKWRFVLAIIIAGLQIIGWGAVIVMLMLAII